MLADQCLLKPHIDLFVIYAPQIFTAQELDLLVSVADLVPLTLPDIQATYQLFQNMDNLVSQ
jgi:hypothetical protein